jgi:hypothetical protein
VKLVTVPNYPLVKVGTWSSAIGPKSISEDDLKDIVEAHESKALDLPVIKKGHLDPRHQNPAWDGEPAYGQVDNLRLSEDGKTLLGDYVNMPEELAESLPSAYPHRSVEIAWGLNLKDETGKVTKKFKAALAGLALLGRTPPAVKGLGGPVSAMSGSVDCDRLDVIETTNFSLPGGLTANALREALDSAIQKEFRRPASNDMEVGEYPWMTDYTDTTAWFRSNGGVFQVTYTADDAGVITLNDDVTEVVERRTYVPVSDTPPVPQTKLSGTEANTVLGTFSANEQDSNREEPPMSEVLKKLRDKLGLPETATEEEILTAAAEANLVPKAQEDAENKDGQNGAPAADAVTSASDNTGAGKHAAPGAAPAEGAPKDVVVSAVAFSELMATSQANAAELKTLKEDKQKAHVEGLITQFSAAGKIHPTEKDYFRGQLMTNEPETVTYLSARVGIPVQEIGSENADTVNFGEQDFGAALSFFDVGGNK